LKDSGHYSLWLEQTPHDINGLISYFPTNISRSKRQKSIVGVGGRQQINSSRNENLAPYSWNNSFFVFKQQSLGGEYIENTYG
jgi:hypothetical protein